MLEEVTKHAMVNKLFREVMKAGPGPIAKLERRCKNRWDVQDILEEVMEQRKMEWQLRWDMLELELVQAMECDMNQMEVEEWMTAR